MRVTNNMMIANMVNNLQTNLRRLDKTALQHSTGKRIHKPSDDPVAITRSLKLQADIKELKQYKKNVGDATSWLENTEEAVISNHEALKRLRDIMVQGANGVLSKEDMENIQNEVGQIKNQIISLANSTYSGDYIFSGKNTDKKLLNQDGSYNISIMQFLDSSVVDHRINYELGVGEYMPVNTVGTTLFEAANLTMGVKLPTEDGPDGATKMEFLGAEIGLERKYTADATNDPLNPIPGYEYTVEITIGEEITETFNISVDGLIKKDEDGNNVLDNNGNPVIIIDEAATKAKIYDGLKNTFDDIKSNPDQAESWNKLLIEKNIPVDINNLTFGIYTNRDINETDPTKKDKSVGLLASPQKAGLISLIEKIEKNLLEGNNEEVSELLGSLDYFMDQSLVVRSEIGAKVNRTKLINDRIEDDIINLRALQSKLEDADLAETAMQLMNEENVYRSSLAVGARIIQPTLLDFLR